MKVFTKLISIISIFLLLSSCGSHPAKKMSSLIKNFPVGISEKEFNQRLSGQELVYSDNVYSTYKVTISTFNYIHHSRTDYRFFYFKNGFLERIDKGERKVDYRIKIDN